MTRVAKFLIVFGLGGFGVKADTFWVRWDDGWPEQQGWKRYSSNPPAKRWLEDGKLFIDSRADWFISEIYGQDRPGMMRLQPGQTFTVRWRVKVHEVAAYTDPAVYLRSDDYYDVKLSLGVDGIHSFYEPGKWAPFARGQFHEFAFDSSDMRTYRLHIDGKLAFEGAWFESLPGVPGAGWGDMSSDRSLAEWDWLEYGIVPEPAGALLLTVGICASWPLSRSATRRFRGVSQKEKGHETQLSSVGCGARRSANGRRQERDSSMGRSRST